MLTTESFAAALDRLEPDGILVVSRWLQIPPSEDLRLIATLVDALERHGNTDPAGALVAYRGIQTITALVRHAGWTKEELATVREFVDARRYDLVWAPDITPEEANRYNRLPTPEHSLAVKTLLDSAGPTGRAGRRRFFQDYPYAVEPATDDRPFFFHFFRWSQAGAVLATLGRTWQPFGGSGYLILFALLALVLVLSAVLILLPLMLRRTGGGSHRQATSTRIVGYFGLLGIAFMCVEVPLIQRWMLAFGYATYAFTAVVLVVLVGSSLGSLALPRLQNLIGGRESGSGNHSPGNGFRGPERSWREPAGVAVLTLITAVAGGPLIELSLGWPAALRLAALILSLGPLAFMMGIPFPLGLAWIERTAPDATPWAWAVNGCASVVASIAAAILALSYGFTAVLLLGALSYALAAGVILKIKD